MMRSVRADAIKRGFAGVRDARRQLGQHPQLMAKLMSAAELQGPGLLCQSHAKQPLAAGSLLNRPGLCFHG